MVYFHRSPCEKCKWEGAKIVHWKDNLSVYMMRMVRMQPTVSTLPFFFFPALPENP